MYSIVIKGKPASHKGGGREKYKDKVREHFRQYNPDATPIQEDAYGIVIYFQQTRRDKTDPDADNISKPIWDSLINECYEDDKIIRLRYAGVFTLSPNTAEELALDDIDDTIADDFIKLLLNQESFVYIHIGALQSMHYKMKL